MKYRNLKISFQLENVIFTVLSINVEKQITPIPKHSHSHNSYELHYISDGSGTLALQDQEYHVSPGTFYMTGPDILHEQISDLDFPITEYGIYLQVKLPSPGTPGPFMEKFLRHLFWIGDAGTTLHEPMKNLIYELEQQQDGYELMIISMLQQVILLVTRLYKKDEFIHSSKHTPSKNADPGELTYLTIEEAFLYNYKDLTLVSLSSQLHLGMRQTQRLLKKHYHKTFIQKKTEARMSAACLMLQNSTKSISSISWELGYSSPEHFTGAFKNFYHITPTEYRKQIQKDKE